MKWNVWMVAIGALTMAAPEIRAEWKNLLTDDFSAPPTAWTYSGVLNASSEPLFRHDPTGERIVAEWDQDNYIDGFSDPFVISNSYFAHPLPQPLTDRHSFRLRATLRIDAGSIPDTTEFYQIASIGLYGLASMGPDRTLADDWSGNSVLLKNASDLTEFSYFINNESFGFNPNISALIAGHVTNNTDFIYITGSSADVPWFHNTDMGPDHYLPENTDIFLELTYFGGGTHAKRRLHVALYTDPTRTNIVVVNGVPQYYWTKPLPDGESFEVTHVAMVNYAALNWGGALGGGSGAWDDISVDLFDGQQVEAHLDDGTVVVTWTSRVGDNYAVVSASNLLDGVLTTQAVVSASSGFTSWTGTSSTAHAFYFIKPLP